MSEFLLVIPEGWTEIADPESIVAMESWLGCSLDEAREWLKARGDIPEDGFTVADKRVFKDGETVRLWVRIVPE